MPPVSSRPIFTAPISRLPSSLLSYILSHLDHTTLITLHRVCHTWHTTCENPLTWIHTHLALYARACDDVWLYRMMQAQTQRTIHLPVRHLTLCTTTVTSRTLSSLSALIGPSLHSLTLDTITLQHPRRPTVPSITSMISCALHTLTITWEMISIVNLIAIGQMSTLRILNMTWKMPVFNSRGLEPRHFEPLQQLKDLTSLSITCAPSFNTSTPIDEFLIATLSPSASLTSLSLHGHHFTARVMKHITTTCTNLHELNLANTGFWNLPASNRNTPYELAPYLSLSNLKHLQSLQLSASALCNDGMMAAMELDTCTSLIRLSCAAPMAICRRPMNGSFLSTWSHSSSLHELALPHAQLTDTTITSLVQHCPKLQSLSLAYNITMTNDAMDILAQLKHLTHINLRHTMIDDDGLIRFATSTCAPMISIDIRGCDGITVDGIVHVQQLLLCDVIHDIDKEEESISHHPHFHRPSISHSCSEQSETSQVQWMEMRNVVDAK